MMLPAIKNGLTVLKQKIYNRDRGMGRLEGKTALITGAARGIGKSIAETFWREGAFVIITDINDEAGKAVAGTFKERCVYQHLDVRFENEWITIIQKLQEQDRLLHIVVNNAGITGFQDGFVPHDPENASLEHWRSVHEVNLDGVFLGCKYGIQALKAAGGGSIINISSRSGVVGIPRAAAYASSKAAVRNHTKSVALYCAEMGYKIRCNSIHPAAILTTMWDDVLGTGETRPKEIQNVEAGIPLGRFGVPEDVAYAALYLASDESTYITGAEFTIDGGILAGASAVPWKPE